MGGTELRAVRPGPGDDVGAGELPSYLGANGRRRRAVPTGGPDYSKRTFLRVDVGPEAALRLGGEEFGDHVLEGHVFDRDVGNGTGAENLLRD